MGLRIITTDLKRGERLTIPARTTKATLSASEWAEAHQVALETDEVDPHGDCAVGVAAKRLDPVHQVCTELVASFQHAQHHDVMVPQVIHDVSSQTFCPVNSVRPSLLTL